LTHQPDRSWLKDVAPKNIKSISITFEVSQFEMLELKALASLNMLFITVTLEVFQFEMSELKANA